MTTHVKIPSLACKLDGLAHYTAWRDLATRMMMVNDLWNVVNGTSKRPSLVITEKAATTTEATTTAAEEEGEEEDEDNADEILEWEKKNNLAIVFLQSNIEFEIILTLTPSETAHDLWTQLEDRFDRKTVASLHSLLGNVLNLQYTPDKGLKEHLTEFSTLWSQLLTRTSNSTDQTKDPLGYHLHQFAAVSEVKASFLLLSLQHESLEAVVDNLQSKPNVTYDDVYEKLLDLDSRRTQISHTGEAYNIRRGNPRSNNNNNNRVERNRPRQKNSKELTCTWCTKNGEYAKGHTHKDCRKLKAFRDKEKPAASGNIHVASGTAFHTKLDLSWLPDLSGLPALDESDVFTMPTSFDTTNFSESSSDTAMEDYFALVAGPSTFDHKAWIFDPGATNHMTGTLVTNPAPHSGTVTVGGGRKLKITGIGNATINGSHGLITLENVFLVPELGNTNLMSWSCIARKGYTTTGTENGFTIYKPNSKEIIGIANANSTGLYIFETKEPCAHLTTATTFYDWHQRLGHLPASSLSRLRNMVADPKSLPTTGHMETCNTCELAKSTKQHLAPLTSPRSKAPLELIHSDLSGKFSTVSLGGFSYYITFIDDYSRYAHLYFLKKKSDAAEATKTYIAYMENQLDKKVKRFRSDNGGEYISDTLKQFFISKGIKHELTVPYSHESNGIAERFNRTIATMARSALLDHTLPKGLWAEAINAMVHVKNRLPHKSLPEMTPYEALTGNKPYIGHLRSFGETVFIHIPVESRPARTKLDPRAITGRFVGYGDSAKICRVYIPSQRKVVLSRHFRFKGLSVGEEITPIITEVPPQPKQKQVEIEIKQEPTSEHESNNDDSEQLSYDEQGTESEDDSEGTHASKVGAGLTRPAPESHPLDENKPDTNQRRNPIRERKAPERYGHYTEKDETLAEPNTYQQAITSPDSEKWQQAMEAEMESLARNNTWKLVNTPTHRKLVDCKWVYKIKLGPDGNPIRYKARLVAKGFSQVPGQDFDQTFAPVTRYESIRLLLARTLQTGGKCDQMDVTSAFLYGELQEEIYMKSPPGYPTPGKACKLIKCIYGLKQSSREWYARLSKTLIKMGFRKADFDPCVFIHRTGEVVIAIYVDDILIFHWSDERKNKVSLQLHAEFEMTEAGTANWALGIHLIHTSTGIILSQEAYLKRVLIKYGFDNSRPVATPIDNNASLQKGTEKERIDDPTLYQSIIGSLMYAVIGTRPDLAYTVTMLSQFSSCPTKDHMTAVHRVLRYLKGTLNWSLFYAKTPPTALIGYSDASYASDLDDRRSFTGHCFMLGEALISWRSYKQRSVATSTTEAEYMALSDTSRQLIWLRNAIHELERKPTISFILRGDNNGSLSLVRNPVFHKRSKHIDVHFHFVREKHEDGLFQLEYISTNDNVADLLTKGLDKGKHVLFSSTIHCGSRGEVSK